MIVPGNFLRYEIPGNNPHTIQHYIVLSIVVQKHKEIPNLIYLYINLGKVGLISRPLDWLNNNHCLVLLLHEGRGEA